MKATALSEVVISDGMSPIVNNDETGAYNAAVHDALKNALGLVVGVYVSQEALVSKAMLIEDNITSQTEGYVERYDVQKRWRDGDFSKVTIKALVRKEDLAKKIESLDLEQKKLGNPVVAVNIDEIVDGQPSPDRYAGDELKKSFIQEGFVVADSSYCDIEVTGRASSSFNTDEGLSGLVSYRGTVALTVRMNASHDVITTQQETVGGVDATRSAAAKAAVVAGAKKIGGTLPKTVLTFLKDHSTVRLSVENVPNINTLNSLNRSIRALIEVRDCRVRNYENGTAVVDVAMKKGCAPDLAKRLEQLTSFKLIVDKTSAYGVETKLSQ
jgi:hypothetical protein